MSTLFSIDPSFPPGFEYFPDFLSVTEENELLLLISRYQLHSFNFHGFEAKRKVASFGFDYSFDKRNLNEGKSLPHEFKPLIKKTALHLGMPVDLFAELLITEYPVGSVINWHRDAPPFGLIAGISLHCDCTFRLRPHDKNKQGRASITSFPVKRRSLYVMQGDAREKWQHSISPVPDVRYSLTLRTLRAGSK